MSARWFMVPAVSDDGAAPSLADLEQATDLTPYIEETDRIVRDLVYRYVPPAPKPIVAEGVTTAWQVIWPGVPGPALAREVAVLVDADGLTTVEPLTDWQDVTVVDDTGETP